MSEQAELAVEEVQPTQDTQPEAKEESQGSKEEPKQPEEEPKEPEEDLDSIESEPDTDDEGNEKTVSVKRIKGMAAQAKKYQSEIKELQEKVNNSIPAYDVREIRSAIGDPDKFQSLDDYDDALSSYVNQTMHDQVQLQIRKARAISNFHNEAIINGGIDLSKLPEMPEDNLILTAESKAAAHLAKMLIDDPNLAEMYKRASPQEVRDFITTTEGRLQALSEESKRMATSKAEQSLSNLLSGVETLTSGRLNSEKLNNINLPTIVTEAVNNLPSGPELAVYLHDKPESVKKLNELSNMNPYAAMVELGRIESKALFYSRSNEFKSKYPQSSSFGVDKTLKGGATAPKGLNVKDDGEFNRRYNQRKGK